VTDTAQVKKIKTEKIKRFDEKWEKEEESAASILNGQKWSKRNGKRVAKKIREGVGCLLRHLNLSLCVCDVEICIPISQQGEKSRDRNRQDKTNTVWDSTAIAVIRS
jgi:hypothetical protein